MSKSKVLRENQFQRVPIDISCDKSEDGFQITANCLYDNLINSPIKKESGIPFSIHPLLRPYDKFLLTGDPNIGKITHIFISHKDFEKTMMVCSIINTNVMIIKRRILIFPAWGEGVLELINRQTEKKRGFPISHITIEENNKEEISIHLSGPLRVKKSKKRIFPSATPALNNPFGIHIGTLVKRSENPMGFSP